MSKVSVFNRGNTFNSIVTNGKVSIAVDKPGGVGLDPMEMVLSGLLFCKVATIRFVAMKKGYDLESISADISSEEEKREGTFHTTVKVKLKMEGDLTKEQRKELIKSADSCHVHKVLEGEMSIGFIELEY